MKKALVIGSGAVGLSSAYYLNQAGFEVEVISADTADDSKGCSFGNAGMIVPSHFTPLAAPGVIREGMKWLLNPRSPLYIKPRLNSDFLSWMWHFIRSSNAENVERSSASLLRMNQESRDLFATIEKQEGLDYHYKKGGLMMLYKSTRYQDEEEHMAEIAKLHGLEVEILDKEAMRLHENKLKADVLGGVWYKSDAHILPQEFMIQMIACLQKKGVGFTFNSKVLSFDVNGNKVKGIKTSTGVFEADEIVVCTGSWSQEIVKGLNINLPIQGGKGYHLHIKDVPLQLNTPSILCEARVAITPMERDLRVSGTMEFGGLNLNINKKRVEGIEQSVGKYFEAFDEGWFKGIEPWAGLRPVSPDGLPYIGRFHRFKNLSFNTGHAMMGLSLAPISGKLLTQILLGNEHDYSIDIFSPNRFS